MLETKFYICTHCGNIVEVINDSGVPLICCGQKMQKLIAGENEDAAVEKHIPIYIRPELNTQQCEIDYLSMLMEALEETENGRIVTAGYFRSKISP